MSGLPSATLTISIDLDDDSSGVNSTAARQATIASLLDLLAQHRLHATWAVADPAHSMVPEQIRASAAGHELALVGDRSWVGRSAGRSRFARELTRRTVFARQAGLPVSTLVLKHAQLQDSDLAIKHGITAVRHERLGAGGPQGIKAQTLRFGLWSFPVSATLPGTSRWFAGGGGRAARHGIDLAVSERSGFQLVIEGPRLAARPAALRVMHSVLEHVALRQRQGALDVLTLAGAAAQASAVAARAAVAVDLATGGLTAALARIARAIVARGIL